MEYRRLGRSDIEVSAICLGTMTFGRQNTQAHAFEQMDYALGQGVNFWDNAEMYSVPPSKETYGRTEEIIGNWFKSRGLRNRVVLATKVAGPDERFPYIRDGKPKLSRAHIVAAVEASLRRLQTDYIDLYQLHWAERDTNAFGTLGYAPVNPDDGTPLAETLDALAEVAMSGKVQQFGISNESAWGAMRYLALAEFGRGPRMASIQNAYSLLNRSFEVGLAEVAVREGCGLLAYSPLGMGVLSGKYLNGVDPPGARLTLYRHFRRCRTPAGVKATAAYVKVARPRLRLPADGACLRHRPAVRHGQYHRGDDDGAAHEQHCQQRAEAVRRCGRRHRSIPQSAHLPLPVIRNPGCRVWRKDTPPGREEHEKTRVA
jgi:aryl-alcohol dehydrogenase-like predicted oxidoreductase